MPVTMKQVRVYLDPDEPDYDSATALGPDAIPHLMSLVQGSEPMLAAKATYLASLIRSESSNAVLEDAAKNSQELVRVAAAASIRNLPDAPLALIERLLSDSDAGVRKASLRSIEARQIRGMKSRVAEVAQRDSESFLRTLADHVAERLS